MSHEKIEILDIEESANSFTVIFEVPGHHYEQDYPKRITHSFPKEKRWMKEDENGVPIYEKRLRELYIKDKEEEKEKKQVSEKLKDEKKRLQGKTFKNKPGK